MDNESKNDNKEGLFSDLIVERNIPFDATFDFEASSEKLFAMIQDLSKIIENDWKLISLPKTRKSTSVTAIKHLKEAYTRGNLNFVVGAGISSGFGIPTWENLLQRLLMTTIETETDKAVTLSKFFSKIFNPSPLIAGRYLEESFKDENNKNKFESQVREALYETFNDNFTSLIIEEIVKFCVAPRNSPNLDGIITYNYDDIIEAKLKDTNLDIPFESVFGQAVSQENNILKIYHVHGFLPRKGKIGIDNKITLGEFVYHEQYSNTYSWNNIVQINKFRDKTCLFIGTSLTDPNIRRLLDIARSQRKSGKFHYIFKKRTDKAWLKSSINKLISENQDSKEDKIMDLLQVEDTINFLTELKNRFEEKDSESLGVKTVWIDYYDQDISEILKKIRL
ncbi:SIR2 family protein [Flavobacterium ardleyense]|uniref:SIR2 family protein n=1 Tax=Flavobacterium ardleyense TaxID=2038737 RepID=UPI00298D1590|nr:SIR2 family protein [Flavobacterium ardleyense]